MRGRILMAMILSLATVVACSRKDSIYIEPGKQDGAAPEPATPPPPAKSEPAKPPARPAESPAPKR